MRRTRGGRVLSQLIVDRLLRSLTHGPQLLHRISVLVHARAELKQEALRAGDIVGNQQAPEREESPQGGACRRCLPVDAFGRLGVDVALEKKSPYPQKRREARGGDGEN